jgi:Uncharacterized protein conserved in bacteria (DUF2188)
MAGSSTKSSGLPIPPADTLTLRSILAYDEDISILQPGGRHPASPSATSEFEMSHVTYKIVQHDGGWAYTVDGVFSEAFPSHAAALTAARRAAAEQRTPGRTEMIEYETADGKWHTETAAGSDRPETDVEDKP